MTAKLIDLACILAWVILSLPCIVYLVTEWRFRRDRLFDFLNENALTLYYEQFYPSAGLPTGVDHCEKFRRDFSRRYGRKRYILPLVLLALISGIGIWLADEAVQSWLALRTARAIPAIAVSAILGAYAWVLNDQFSRLRRHDFSNYDVYNCTYRFLITVPFGVAFSAILKNELGVPLAFLLGAFPTATLFKFARRIVVQRFSIGEDEEASPNDLVQLQGIPKSNAERFQHEGIAAIVELAWCDPIDLTIRTNFEFLYVLDCVGQALLWVYLESAIKDLYRYSLRGSQEVVNLMRQLDDDDPEVRAVGQQRLQTLAVILKMDTSSLIATLEEVAEDPYAQFVSAVWA